MAYSSWSVVFGEQPAASKWNILGTNDASFNDGTGIANLAWNTTAVSNPYKFSVSRNAAANTGSAAFAVLAFDTEQYDTNNNVASGVYTAPVTGFYQFNWSVTGQSGLDNELFVASLFVGGTENKRGGAFYSGEGSEQYTLTGAALVNLTATNTVDIRVFGTAARALTVGTVYGNRFEGYLVSRT